MFDQCSSSMMELSNVGSVQSWATRYNLLKLYKRDSQVCVAVSQLCARSTSSIRVCNIRTPMLYDKFDIVICNNNGFIHMLISVASITICESIAAMLCYSLNDFKRLLDLT